MRRFSSCGKYGHSLLRYCLDKHDHHNPFDHKSYEVPGIRHNSKDHLSEESHSLDHAYIKHFASCRGNEPADALQIPLLLTTLSHYLSIVFTLTLNQKVPIIRDRVLPGIL